ncbi:MAG: PKD domain-containing protein, partial [Verrucomicrobiota bacterium]
PNGERVVAGTSSRNQNWGTQLFPISFSASPVVLAQAATVNGAEAVTTRIRSVSSNSFQSKVQEEEANNGAHPTETVHWIAVERGSMTGTYNSAFTTGNVSSSWTVHNFGQNYGTSPHLLAGFRTHNDGNPVALRYRNIDGDSVEFFAEEEKSGDTEITHAGEGVGYLVIDSARGVNPFTVSPLAVTIDPSAPFQSGTNQAFTLNVSGGADPQFTWNFGDGTAEVTTGSSSITHNYNSPGRYFVTVNASDSNGASIELNFLQNVHPALASNLPAVSQTVIYEERTGNDRVWNVNPDNDTVTVTDALMNIKLAEIPVGDHPRSLALAPNGTIWVANKKSATISILNAGSLSVQSTINLPRASSPHGLVFSPLGSNAFVALEALGQIYKLNPSTGATVDTLAVGTTPRHLSMSPDGTILLVSRFISPPVNGEHTGNPNVVGGGGEVIAVNPGNLSIIRTILIQHSIEPDTGGGGRGIPNYLGPAATSPAGDMAWVPSKQDNIERGVLRNGQNLDHDNTVRAITSMISLSTEAEVYGSRVDLDDAAVPSTALFGPNGLYVYVALEGSREVAVIDAYGAQEITRFDSGRAVQGLALSADGNALYVHNFMDRTITVHDISALTQRGETTTSLTTTYDLVANETLSAEVLLGKQIFHDAKDDRISLQDYLSCAACHNDGDHDGRVWDFTGFGEGLRNTLDLRGKAGMGHGPLHWTGNFDEIQDFENQIRDLAQGTGLINGNPHATLSTPNAGRSSDLDALAAYVSSLTVEEPSPYRTSSGNLTSAATSGRNVFIAKNCAECHSGAAFTDSALNNFHNVGTIKSSSGNRLGATLTGFDTPTLRGVWNGAPYLHDRSAATLAAALNAHNNVSLTSTERNNLVAYLQQIDANEGSAPANGAPTVSSPGNQSGSLGDNVNLAISASDPNGQNLTYTASGLPNNLSINSGSGVISGTLNQTGTFNVTVTATNPGNASGSTSFTWNVSSNVSAPVITAFTASPGSIQQGSSATLSWNVNNGGGSLTTLSINQGVGNVLGSSSTSVSPSSTRTYTLTASNSAGTDTANVTVTVTTTGGGGSEEYSVDAETIALYHFNGDYEDASGNGFHLQTSGGVTRTSSNLGWMQNPSGQVARFSAAGDTLTVSIPDSFVMPTSNTPLTLEARIYPRAYRGYGVGNLPILAFEQHWDSNLGLEDNKWGKNPKGPHVDANNVKVLSRQEWQNAVSFGQWHLLQISFDGAGKVHIRIDGTLIKTISKSPNGGRTSPWNLTLGNFDGDIDEVLIRQSPDPADVGPPPPDLTPPSLTLSTPTNNVSGPFNVTATFSEAVTGFQSSDVVVNNGSKANFTGSGSLYTFIVDPTADGQVSLSVPAGRLTDLAGNANTASNILTVSYTEPTTGGGNGDEYGVDSDTIALYHFNSDYSDATGQYDLSPSGSVQLAGDNLTWMSTPAGKVARFSNAGDTLSVPIPDNVIMPNGGAPVTIDVRIFPRAYKGYSVGNLPVVQLYQHWDNTFELKDNKWASDRAPSVRTSNVEMLSAAEWKQVAPLNQWHQLQIAFDGSNTVQLYVNGNLLNTSIKAPNFSRGQNWTLTLGNFDGDIDEVLVTKAPPTLSSNLLARGEESRRSVRSRTSNPLEDYPQTWTAWMGTETRSVLGNADGDQYNDLLEYALGEDPDSGIYRFSGLRIEPFGDVLQVRYERPYAIGDVSYMLEVSDDMVSWTDIPDGPRFTHRFELDGRQVIRYENMESLSGRSTHGFVRLRVELGGSDARAWTEPCVWFRTPVAEGFQTFGLSSVSVPAMAGIVESAGNDRIGIGEDGLPEIVEHLLPAYIEITDGLIQVRWDGAPSGPKLPAHPP